jgi:hypothetical protein
MLGQWKRGDEFGLDMQIGWGYKIYEYIQNLGGKD